MNKIMTFVHNFSFDNRNENELKEKSFSSDWCSLTEFKDCD